MRIVYIADDGREFNDEFECSKYEWVLSHPNLKCIKCFDENGNELKDVMEDNTYNWVNKIIVPTDEAVNELHDLAEYTGFCYYHHITSPGIWIYKEESHRRRSFTQGYFVKAEDYVEGEEV